MPQLPPSIDITGPDTRKGWINEYQKALWAACMNIDNTAICLHRDMANALRDEGVDQAGRFGGSSADKAAGTVSSKLKRASEHIEAAIKLLKGADAAAEKSVDAPIKAAQAARARSKSSYTV